MSKIVDWAVDTFVNFNSGSAIRKKVNDMVYQYMDCIIWNFHGNTIAKRNIKDDTVMMTLCGWPTKSTMDRLNTLCQKLGIKGYPFRGYVMITNQKNRDGISKATFCGNPIGDTEEIVIKLSDIDTGVYNYEQ